MRVDHHDGQGGFSLIEVLITLFVFSIGLLTVAGLQGISKKANYDAVQRTTATLLAQDIVERMRANSSVADLTLADYLAEVGAGIGGNSKGGAPATDCLNVACTSAQLAAFDVWQWEQALDGAGEVSASGNNTGGLVFPTGCITGPAAGVAGTYTIAIAWRGVSELSNPTINACGEGSGAYGTSDEFRRILVIETYITPT